MKGRSVSWHSVSPFYSFAKFVLQVLTQYRDTISKKRTTSPSLALSFTTWGFQVLTQYLPTWWSWEMHLMVLRDVLDGPERCTWWPWKMYSMVLRDALDGLERCTWWSWDVPSPDTISTVVQVDERDSEIAQLKEHVTQTQQRTETTTAKLKTLQVLRVCN